MQVANFNPTQPNNKNHPQFGMFRRTHASTSTAQAADTLSLSGHTVTPRSSTSTLLNPPPASAPPRLTDLLSRRNEIKTEIKNLKSEIRSLQLSKAFSRGDAKTAKEAEIQTKQDRINTLRAEKTQIKGDPLVIEYNDRITREMEAARADVYRSAARYGGGMW